MASSLLPSGIITSLEELLISIEIRCQKMAHQFQSLDLHYQKMGACFSKVLEILEKEEMESDLTDPAPILTDKMEDDTLGGSVPPESTTSAMKITSATSKLGINSAGSRQLQLRAFERGSGKIYGGPCGHGTGQINNSFMAAKLDRTFSCFNIHQWNSICGADKAFSVDRWLSLEGTASISSLAATLVVVDFVVLYKKRWKEQFLGSDKPPPWPPPSRLENTNGKAATGSNDFRRSQDCGNKLNLFDQPRVSLWLLGLGGGLAGLTKNFFF